MGNLLTKCCQGGEKKKGKYVNPHGEEKKPEQAQQDESDVNSLTNKGSTIKDSDTKISTKDANEPSEQKVHGKTNPEKKTENIPKDDQKNRKKKKKRRKHWDSDSSDSSSSSSSDSGVEYKARKTGSRAGRTTVYNKTVIGGNKFTIGKNANITMNISDTTVDTSGERKPFTSKYGEQAATAEERRLWETIPKAAQNGCFVNLNEKRLVKEYVFNMERLIDMSQSVGMIYIPGGGNGTCFRVGPNHIMTALHVIKTAIHSQLQNVGKGRRHTPIDIFDRAGYQPSDGNTSTPERLIPEELNVTFSYIHQNQPPWDTFKLKSLNSIADIPFWDNETDCIVLELCDDTRMPKPFQWFSIPHFDKPFHLIGHGGGSAKRDERVDVWIDPKSDGTRRDVEFVKGKSDSYLKKYNMDANVFRYQPNDEYNFPLNEGRFLFHCHPEFGESGAPGVVVCGDGSVVVVTMLLCGYPDWYYSRDCGSIKSDWPKEYCIEQGASMQRILEIMQERNPTLCQSIFNRPMEQ